MTGALVVKKRPSSPRLRLLCFPCAGAAASIFNDWHGMLGADVEVAAVQYPGREHRFREPFATSIAQLVADVLQSVDRERRLPLALLGHSFGGRVAYEFARAVESQGRHRVEMLYVAAARSPQVQSRQRLHSLDDERLVQELRSMNGENAAAFDNPDLAALMMPRVRADFFLSETALTLPAPKPLSCKIKVLAGVDDVWIREEDLGGWRHCTSEYAGTETFAGGHFFPINAFKQVLAWMEQDLRRVVAANGVSQPFARTGSTPAGAEHGAEYRPRSHGSRAGAERGEKL